MNRPSATGSRPDVSPVGSRLWVGAAVGDPDCLISRQRAGDLATRAAVGLVVDCRLGCDDRDMWARHRVRYLNIGVEDAGAPLPEWFFTMGVEAVFEHWVAGRSQGSVLLHCESGVHRSPALALAVLLADGFVPHVARGYLSASRPSVGPRYFDDAVRWFEEFSGVKVSD